MSTDAEGNDPKPKPEPKPRRERGVAARAADSTSKKRDWKLIVIGVLVFLALVGSLAAWLQGKASRQSEVDSLTAERDECSEAKATLEDTEAQLRDRIAELEARRQVSRAVEQLVARNFGSARDALRSAREGLASTGHEALAERIAAIELIPTDDVGEQRDLLLSLARDVDRALGDPRL